MKDKKKIKLQKMQVATKKLKESLNKNQQLINKKVNSNENSPNDFASTILENNVKTAVNDISSVTSHISGNINNKDKVKYYRYKKRLQTDNINNKTNSKVNISDMQNNKFNTVNKQINKLNQNKKVSSNSIGYKYLNNTKYTIWDKSNIGKTKKITNLRHKNNAKKITQKSIKSVTRARKIRKTTISIARKVLLPLKKLVTTRILLNTIFSSFFGIVVIIILICGVIALTLSGVFGMFFSNDVSNSNLTIKSVINEINTEHQNKIEQIKQSNNHDRVEISGNKSLWKDVLSVYSVKLTTDKYNSQDAVIMTDEKKQLLKNIFWDMNEISHRLESKTEIILEETADENGEIITTEKEVTLIYLYINLTHKNLDEISLQYSFDRMQNKNLQLLLSEESNFMWDNLLYGINNGDKNIVDVALSQVGNIGGEPYWKWYGFSSRVEWCATFVSWCANECGYIENGILPKFASCKVGYNWFKDRNRWRDKTYNAKSGDIIFFDWENDGVIDHVGIVEKVENGYVYTIEGNSNDMCKQNSYHINNQNIYGYGVAKNN